MTFETIRITETGSVAHIELARPDKANALNAKMWSELRAACEWLSDHSPARAAVLSGQGSHFTTGIDFELLLGFRTEVARLPENRRVDRMLEFIVELQDCVNAIETCRKPILAAVHGVCYGAGLDIITACDLRLAASNAKFSVKEIDLAIVADLGTLQRLPRLIGEGRTRELAYTGRAFDSQEALHIGLVHQVYADAPSLLAGALEQAAVIARKSPQAVRGLKQALNYSREHTLAEGLRTAATHNAAALFSKDFEEALSAVLQKRPAIFDD
jgi:enoyl-CoA hydratase